MSGQKFHRERGVPTNAMDTSSKLGEPLTGRKRLRFPLRE